MNTMSVIEPFDFDDYHEDLLKGNRNFQFIEAHRRAPRVTIESNCEDMLVNGAQPPPQVSSLLKFALLKNVEKEPWSGLWGYAFHDSPEYDQFHVAKSATARYLEKQARGCKIRISCLYKRSRAPKERLEQPADGRGTKYALNIPKFTHVASNVLRAADEYAAAVRQYHAHDIRPAIKSAVNAVACCAEFYPSYVLLSKLLATARSIDEKKPILQRDILVLGIQRLRSWLRELNVRLARKHICNESTRTEIQNTCLKSIAGRLQKLEKLELYLNAGTSQPTVQTENPLNVILEVIRELDAKRAPFCILLDLIPAEITNEYKRLIDEALESLERNKTLSSPSINVDDLHAALIDCARDEIFRFPDPADPRWKLRSVALWIKAALPVDMNHDPKLIPLTRRDDRLQAQHDPDVPIKTKPQQKPTYLSGDQNTDD